MPFTVSTQVSNPFCISHTLLQALFSFCVRFQTNQISNHIPLFSIQQEQRTSLEFFLLYTYSCKFNFSCNSNISLYSFCFPLKITQHFPSSERTPNIVHGPENQTEIPKTKTNQQKLTYGRVLL